MENLYIIVKKNTNLSTVNLLETACVKKNIKLIIIHPENFNFTDIPILSKNDGLYRISGGHDAILVEKKLINNQVKTFYKNMQFCLGRINTGIGGILVHEKEKLPIIPTLFGLPKRKFMESYLKEIKQFPIIIKALGNMHGVGVMKIDSKESFVSIVDYLREQDGDFIIRDFIHHNEQARIVVLGNKVISSHGNMIGDDFRTNAGSEETRKRIVKSYPTEIQELAIKAVHSLGFEFGGVDILFEKDTNRPYISEVNYPFFFPGNQKLTGCNIAEQMIDYLNKK